MEALPSLFYQFPKINMEKGAMPGILILLKGSGCSVRICECNKDGKKGEIGNMFEMGNLYVLALSITKLKRKGEVWFRNVL